jgi:hypothetical protein
MYTGSEVKQSVEIIEQPYKEPAVMTELLFKGLIKKSIGSATGIFSKCPN